MSLTDAQKRAKEKYESKVKRYEINFFPTEADIIAKLEDEKQNGGYATYIKNLIREDLKKQ